MPRDTKGRERARQQRPTGPLYSKLRPRPHGPSREEVVRNQRERLAGAMIDAVCANGYKATSVAEVSRLAGVSKRTFYEQFDNKQDCFLATYDRVVDGAVRRIHAARARHERDWEGALRSAFEAFVLSAAEQPKAARFALVEAHGVGPAALTHIVRADRRFELAASEMIREGPHGAPLPPAVVRGIVYGIEHVVRTSLLAGALDELTSSAGELAAWALAHISPAAAELGQPAGAGRRVGGWPRLRAREDERSRLLRAAAEIAAYDGLSLLNPARIIARADVPERTFHLNYETAEACYLDALDLLILEALTSAAAASRSAGDGPHGAYRGIAALLEHIAEDPVLRGLILLDVRSDDLARIGRRERLLDRFADLIAGRLPPMQRPPSVFAQATVGGVWGIIRHYVAADAAHLLPELTGHAAYVALAPVVGAEEAVRTILAEQGASGGEEAELSAG